MIGLSEVCNLSELATILKLSERTIRRLIKSGNLHGRKYENEWVFTLQDILDFYKEPETYRMLKNKYSHKVREFIFDEVPGGNQTLISFYLDCGDDFILGEIVKCIFEFENNYNVRILFFIKDGVPLVICFGKSKNVKEALTEFRSKPQLKKSLQKLRME